MKNPSRIKMAHPVLVLLILFLNSLIRINSDEIPPLILAIKTGDSMKVSELLKSRNSLDVMDKDGNTALHWASAHGRDDLVRELIVNGAAVNATNRLGASPLIFAVGNVKSVSALIEAGANVNHASLSKVRGAPVNVTPLLAAVTYSDSNQVVEKLLKSGANLIPNQDMPDGLIRLAALAGDLKTVDLLLSAGMKPSLLHPAVAGGNFDILKRFIDAGADLDVDQGGVGSALNAALIFQHTEMANLLIENNADLKIPANANRARHDTPSIVLAAYSQTGDTSVAKAMLKRGVDLNETSSRGESALDWARAWGHEDFAMFLAHSGAKPGHYHQEEKDIPNRHLPENEDAFNQLIRESSDKAITLLQHSSDQYFQSGGSIRGSDTARCDSCHHQYLPAWAYGMAIQRGIEVNQVSIARQLRNQFKTAYQNDAILKSYERVQPTPVPPSFLGYGLGGLAELGIPADEMTDAYSWYLAGNQRPDGSWTSPVFRPPMQDGIIADTALVLRVLTAYPLQHREDSWKTAVRRGQEFLQNAQPVSFNQRIFQLLGLGWAGSKSEELTSLVKDVVSLQSANGGWAQMPGLPDDAWATGQALYALHVAGGMDTANPVYQRGIRFLLRTQFADGSWFVRARAWPIQPHFESGFPHGKNQWISAAGTTWAVMALLLTQPILQEGVHTDWMAISIPDNEPPTKVEKKTSATVDPAHRTVDFVRDIQPLFKRSCVGCHSGEKAKGGLVMDHRSNLIKGGDSGESPIVPGNPSESMLIQFVMGDIEDLEMPPKGKRDKYPGLNPEEILLLETWISEGADWPEVPNPNASDN